MLTERVAASFASVAQGRCARVAPPAGEPERPDQTPTSSSRGSTGLGNKLASVTVGGGKRDPRPRWFDAEGGRGQARAERVPVGAIPSL